MYEIIPKLYLSGFIDLQNQLDKLHASDLVVNCTRDIQYTTSATVRRIPIDDNGNCESVMSLQHSLRNVVFDIAEHLKIGNVYVHCRAGQQRSASLVAAFLMSKFGWTADKAIMYVKSRKPDAFFWKANFLKALVWWEDNK